MKITLTPIEAEPILREHFQNIHGYSSSVTVSVQSPIDLTKQGPELPISALITEVRRFRYQRDEKIPAIKAVRELCAKHGVHCGLAEAKYFVEAL